MTLKEGETSIRVPHTRDLKDRLEMARQKLIVPGRFSGGDFLTSWSC
jgi:hypothetical protein